MDPDMAILRIHAGRLAFVYLIERSVEGLHALVKKTVLHARHHSGAYISFALQQPQLKRMLLEQHGALKSLADNMDRCRALGYLLDAWALSRTSACLAIRRM